MTKIYETMYNFDVIDGLVAKGQLNEALTLLGVELERVQSGDIQVAPQSEAELYFRRGKIYWRLGLRTKATSDYAMATSIDHDSPAVKALEQARDIEAFYNPDLYNP